MPTTLYSSIRIEPILDLFAFLKREEPQTLYRELLLPHNFVRLCGGDSVLDLCRAAEELNVLQMLDISMLAYGITAVSQPGAKPIGVNVSYSTLSSGGGRVALQLLEACPEEVRSRIFVEIVENNHLSHISTTKIVGRIKELGTKIVLDDFGAGLHAGQTPNFFMCRSIPDVIKLDGSVVELGTYKQKNNQRMIEQALRFSDLYGSAVVAEKLETEEQVEFMVRSGVQYGQGFFLRRDAKERQFP